MVKASQVLPLDFSKISVTWPSLLNRYTNNLNLEIALVWVPRVNWQNKKLLTRQRHFYLAFAPAIIVIKYQLQTRRISLHQWLRNHFYYFKIVSSRNKQIWQTSFYWLVCRELLKLLLELLIKIFVISTNCCFPSPKKSQEASTKFQRYTFFLKWMNLLLQNHLTWNVSFINYFAGNYLLKFAMTVSIDCV